MVSSIDAMVSLVSMILDQTKDHRCTVIIIEIVTMLCLKGGDIVVDVAVNFPIPNNHPNPYHK